MKRVLIGIMILSIAFLFFSCQDSTGEDDPTTLAETTTMLTETTEETTLTTGETTSEEDSIEATDEVAENATTTTTAFQASTQTTTTRPATTTRPTTTTVPFVLGFPAGTTQATMYNAELLWRTFNAYDETIEPIHVSFMSGILNRFEVGRIVTISSVDLNEDGRIFRTRFFDENNFEYDMSSSRYGTVHQLARRAEDGVVEVLHQPRSGHN